MYHAKSNIWYLMKEDTVGNQESTSDNINKNSKGKKNNMYLLFIYKT